MRHSSNRPIVERLPHIAIKDLVKAIPRDDPNLVYCLDSFGLRFGGARVRVCSYALEITNASGFKQIFRIRWIRTGFGRPRPLLVCASCGKAYQLLYEYYGHWACRRCLKATYLSERISHSRQRLWKAAKKRVQINSIPSRFHSISPKAKGRHSKKYARLVTEIQRLEQQAKHSRIKDFDIKALAYHLQ